MDYSGFDDTADTKTAPESPSYSPVNTPDLKRRLNENKFNSRLGKRSLCAELILDEHFHHLRKTEKFLLGSTELIKISGYEKHGDHFVYLIEVPSAESGVVKRRYSEFESLRKILAKLHPYAIIPPIPEKHSLKATFQRKNEPILEQRQRMLQTFLNRLLFNEVLGSSIVFHVFLTAQGENWAAEVLFSKEVMASATTNNSAGASTRTGGFLKSKTLKNPDLKFQQSELYTQNFHEVVQNLNKTNKKIQTCLKSLSQSRGELGAIYNATSLDDSLSASVKRCFEEYGVGIDQSAQHLLKLSDHLDTDIKDCLYEYDLYSVSVEEILHKRYSKHLKYEELGDLLDQKRQQLDNLEKADAGAISGSVGSGGFMGKIQNMLDSNPEQNRRNQIAKLRDSIISIEKV